MRLPATGDLYLLNHTPPELFTPSIDSFGRVIFTRWDHLQRDQQADTDAVLLILLIFQRAHSTDSVGLQA